MAKKLDKYQRMTYYNLPENYHYFEDGDVTKFDSLTGDEIDANFFVLEGRDINTIDVVKDEETGESNIVITFVNGEKLETENPFDEYIESLSFDYNKEDGVLTVCVNDCNEKPITVEGFLTLDDVKQLLAKYYTYTDNSLSGDGTVAAPLSIARSQRTGCIRLINDIVDELPTINMNIGDRYIIYETVDTYGRYYNFDGLQEVIAALEEEGNGWKVANKPDWDGILNYLESDLYKDHNAFSPSKWLGQKANTKLRQGTEFGLEYCGYAFNGDEKVISFKNEKAGFWAASNAIGKDLTNKDTEAWVKQFQYTKGQVYQTIIDNAIYSSIRLVKECGVNEKVNAAKILGEIYPVSVMLSDDDKPKMWTTINLNYQTENAKNCYKDESALVSKPYIKEWDGINWVTISAEDYAVFMLKSEDKLYYVRNNEIIPVNFDKTPTHKLVEAAEYEYNDYEYKGEFVISNNTIVYIINGSNIGEDNENLINDFSRFLGGLYHTNNVEPIQFNYKYYDWDDEGNNKGSNYKEIGVPVSQPVSLVTAIVAAYQADPTQVFKIKFDHTVVSVTINVVIYGVDPDTEG